MALAACPPVVSVHGTGGQAASATPHFRCVGAVSRSCAVDGGPLGPLSWAFSLLLGTVAYDLLATKDLRRIVVHSLAWGAGLIVLGMALKAQWGGAKAEWMYSQRAMTAPYTLFYTGVCFLTFLLFYIVCDVANLRVPTLAVVGMNPLTIYIVQQVLQDIHGSFIPDNSPIHMALFAFVLFYTACYAVGRRLYDDNIVIRL